MSQTFTRIPCTNIGIYAVCNWGTGHSDVAYLIILQLKKKYYIDDKESQMSHWQYFHPQNKKKKCTQQDWSLSFCTYENITRRWYESSKTTQFRVTIAANCQTLTCYNSYMRNVSYVGRQRLVSSLLFACAASVRREPIIFWCCHINNYRILYNEDGLQLTICVC
jgi:hypothetical protein